MILNGSRKYKTINRCVVQNISYVEQNLVMLNDMARARLLGSKFDLIQKPTPLALRKKDGCLSCVKWQLKAFC